jgi:hypothetical protein
VSGAGIWDDQDYTWDDPRITWVGAVISTPDVQPPRALYISEARLRVPDPPPAIDPDPGDPPDTPRSLYISFAELQVPNEFEAPEVENPALIATPGGGMYVPMGRPHDPHRLTVRP